MKWIVVVALVMALVCGVAAAERRSDIDTETFDHMVADVMEADAAADETAEFEAAVASEDVEAEHAELSAEAEQDAATEFETETQDEVEADATASADDAAVDSAAEQDVAATAQEEEAAADAEAEDAEDAEEEGSSFLEADEEAEAEDESEAEGEAEAEADESAASELSADELAAVLQAQPLLEFEEDVASDAVDDAEDAEARAEEAAAEARFRSTAAHAGADYDEAVAKEMLVYAQTAYYEADPRACAAKLGHTALKVQHTVATDLSDGATVFGMTGVDKTKQRIVVAFNGNVEPKELTAQLMKRKPLKVKTLCKSCKTHPYYVQAYRKVCPQITASVGMLLRKPAFRKYDVWITGHGFGGALAALCGYEMEMSRVFVPDNKRVFVTFGQPRVGNAHWARKFNQHFPQAVRVTHNDDPFPHVPPCHVDPTKRGTDDEQTCFELKDRKKKLWAFHPPTQVWYPNEMPAFDAPSEKGQFQRCDGPNWGEDPTCRHHPLGVSIDDHRNYFGVDVTSHCANLLEPPTDV